VIRGTNDVIPADLLGQELLDPSPGVDAFAPPSAAGLGARASPTVSPTGAPTARAVSGSQNTVTTPSAVSKINVAATTDDVRSALAPRSGAEGGLAFGGALIGRSIGTS
jgi:hypothetical protein